MNWNETQALTLRINLYILPFIWPVLDPSVSKYILYIHSPRRYFYLFTFLSNFLSLVLSSFLSLVRSIYLYSFHSSIFLFFSFQYIHFKFLFYCPSCLFFFLFCCSFYINFFALDFSFNLLASSSLIYLLSFFKAYFHFHSQPF